jgi:hypothetical protein
MKYEALKRDLEKVILQNVHLIPLAVLLRPNLLVLKALRSLYLVNGVCKQNSEQFT